MTHPLYILTIIAALFAIFLLTTALYAGIKTAPFVATPKKIIRRALAEASLRPGEIFYDLGCGDGRALVIAAKEFGARAYGCELSHLMFLSSKLNIFLHNCADKAAVSWGNLYKANISNANVVFTWLTPPAFQRLEEKFNRELKPGARVITYSSPLHFWKQERVLTLSPKSGRIFIYVSSKFSAPAVPLRGRRSSEGCPTS